MNGFINFHSEFCPDGYIRHGVLCIQSSVMEEYKQLNCSGAFDYNFHFDEHRRLTGDNGGSTWDNDLFGERDLGEDKVMRRLTEAGTYSIWDRMSQNAEVPGVLVPLLLIVGALWVLLLQKAALQCIWGAIVFSVSICIFLAVFPLMITIRQCVYPDGSSLPLAEDKASA